MLKGPNFRTATKVKGLMKVHGLRDTNYVWNILKFHVDCNQATLGFPLNFRITICKISLLSNLSNSFFTEISSFL